MSAIEFVVRNDAGGLQRGEVSGSGASANIIIGQSEDVSLNLERAHVLSYARQGQALQVMLVDGEVITIQGFFSPDGQAQSQLFLSSGGQLAEVQLVPGDGNLMLAQYVDSDNFGKWSPNDDLYFTQAAVLPIENVDDGAEATMLGAPLMAGLGGLGGLGAAGAAAVGGAVLVGGSGSNGGSGTGSGTATDGGSGTTDPATPTDPTDPATPTDPTDPTGPTDPTDPTGPTDPTDPTVPVDPTPAPTVEITGGTRGQGHVVNNADYSNGIDISGTGTPGAAGSVTVGTVTVNITIDETGNWAVTIPSTMLPEGEYDMPVSVTVTNAGGSATAADVLDVDTVAFVTFDASTVEMDGTVNFVEESDGVVLSGTTQAGSTVVVNFGGQTYDATVTGDTWTLNVPAGTFPQGEYDSKITVTATDSHGNTATAVDTLEIDTITGITLDTSRTGNDGTVNLVERGQGVTVVGTAEAGARVDVTMGTVTHTVTANAAGNWTATYTASEVVRGEYDLAVTAKSTDAAGNTATVNGSVRIDTEIAVTIDTSDTEGPDGIVNMVERSDGVTLHGTADAGARVEVRFENGVHTVTANAQGIWSADFAASEIRGGNYEGGAPVTVKATDIAGNVATTTGTVQMDTYVNRLTSNDPVEGDNVVNNREASDGITLTGTVEKGSSVMVEFEGTTRAATVTASGAWSVTFAAGEIPQGEYTAVVGIHATDKAGNTASITDTFLVDTVAPDAPGMEGIGLYENGVRDIAIDNTDDPITVHSYDSGGNGKAQIAVDGDRYLNARTGELEFGFDSPVVDGKQLVVTARDDAGNTNSTLLVLDEQSTNNVDITAAGLKTFNIGAIDLTFADKSELSLTKADIDALSSNDNVLVIHGATDDTVTFTGAAATLTGSETINGQAYDVYTVGEDTTIKVDHDIQFNQSLV